MLVEANGAALNNAGQEPGTRVENAIVVKQIRIGRLRYPYVSGQAWRRWWREVLYADFGWQPSEVTVIKKPQQAFTVGDPIRYEEDDLFGYMVARKRAKKGRKQTEEAAEEAEEARGTFRRISPLKNSLLISVLPNVIERDFGHFTRNLPPEADPLLYEAEHYTTHLQGVFTISLADVGCFAIGEMQDLSDDIIKAHEGELQAKSERLYSLPPDRRIKRVQDVLKALARLRGGAHLARNLSDVAPVAALVGFLDGGNAPLQRLFEPDENNERVRLNLTRLRSVLSDHRDRLLTPINGKALYFGYRPTVLTNETDVREAFENEEPFKTCIEVVGTPQEALEKAAGVVASVFEQHIKQ
ncbi:MAG: type I-B CRISPR-associated protein Cas7/Cst2/DevR [Candidatus Acetothermia bacterium]|nr:type I-B CRISPR-associated protein Cas7/Cst2/DevR [Candidatus Acetothermia bacterium]